MSRKEYTRAEMREWGRTICRLRETGPFNELLSNEINISRWTIMELAKEIETSHVSINKWKSGRNYPAGHFVLRLAEAIHGKGDAGDKACLHYLKMIDRERRQNK